MKITIISLAALAALTVAPIQGTASDKEVSKPQHACSCRSQQVALFVSGRGIGDQDRQSAQTVSQGQVGEGGSITFFTGAR